MDQKVGGSSSSGLDTSERTRTEALPITMRPLLLPKALTSDSEQLVDGVGRFLAKHWQDVRVGIHRDVDPRVAEHLHDDRRAVPRCGLALLAQVAHPPLPGYPASTGTRRMLLV